MGNSSGWVNCSTGVCSARLKRVTRPARGLENAAVMLCVFGRKLGNGAFGEIFLAVNTQTGDPVHCVQIATAASRV
eukprot:4314235-Amphidinium_carterae.1